MFYATSDENIESMRQIKALGFCRLSRNQADWALLLSFCDDSNLNISVFLFCCSDRQSWAALLNFSTFCCAAQILPYDLQMESHFYDLTHFCIRNFFSWKICVILTDVLWLVNRFSCSAVFVCSFDFCGACAACFVLLLVAAVQLSARKLILNIAFMICFSWISFHDVHLLFSDRQSFFFCSCVEV